MTQMIFLAVYPVNFGVFLVTGADKEYLSYAMRHEAIIWR